MECPSMSMRRFFSSVTVPQCSGRWGHFGRVVAVNRKFRGWGILGYYFFCAPVAQLAEATDSKPVQCEFESHLGHLLSPTVVSRWGFVLVSCVVTFGSRICCSMPWTQIEPPPGALLSPARCGCCVVLVFVADVCLGEAAAFT